ncbi:MAG TPA: OmpA family protein [Kofleriaceae bacterium]|nr:OmpA family protein [Kofleriaceae bacterium]
MRTALWLACIACSTTRPSTTIVPRTDPVAVPLTAATASTTPAVTTRADLTAPWSLTASDGSGLVVTRIDAHAVVEGPLAFTELHLYFRNPEPRTREGTFQITLPPDAAVARFAMENAGAWMEAEVVPKLVARRAYDDFLHRRQDPALLEKAAGNQFTAKVFPIAARSDKHLVISYSEPLVGRPYTLPLRGSPKAERVDVELSAIDRDGVRRTERLAERNWQPDRDFVATPGTAPAVGAGGMIAARVELAPTTAPEPPRGLTLLVDTSASRGLHYDAYVARVRRLVDDLRARWGDALPLDVIAFDQDTERVFSGRAGDVGDAAFGALRDRGAAGASDLGQAIAWLAKHPAQPRIVVVTDGTITAGLQGRALAATLGATKAERLDVVLVGGLRDERAMAELVRALPHAGAVLDLERDPVARALGDAVAVDIPIAVAGATWVSPTTIRSARAGTQVMVYARLPAGATSVDIAAGAVRRRVPIVAGTPALVERAIAGAELAELETRVTGATGPNAIAVRTAIADRSIAMRILSSETSMLVLETDADYARYGIDRKALADVLVVGPRGLDHVHRTAVALPAHASSSSSSSVTDEPTTDSREPLPRKIVRDPAPASAATAVDHDGDGILDALDKCPSEAESFNGDDDDDGCPDRGRVIVSSSSIEILQPVHFQANRATLMPTAYPVLDAVATTLRNHPDIVLVEIQGHTDELGDDAVNLALSERRAREVVRYLVAKGVDASRLTAAGYGETQPLDRAHVPSAWAKNRRVEFVILRRDSDPMATVPQPAKAAPPPPPVTGELATIQRAITAGQLDTALAHARDWHAREPGNVLALIGLGEALEARGARPTAARIYGSIIDLFPGRADLRRFAGERLGRLANPLAIDTLRRAVADRPDHLTGHRLLAYALVRDGKPADAFAAIFAGLDAKARDDSYAGARRVLGDDAAMIGAVYAMQSPGKRAEITRQLAARKLALATEPSTRFVLYWETDANDVDLHITDGKGRHAFYGQPKLASGGELYADVTTGYGPECFAIPGTPSGGPFRLAVDYYAQGPMGFGMGLLQIQRFDPARGITLEDRPYVIMVDHAKLELGSVP